MYLALKAAVKKIQDGDNDFDAIQQQGMKALELAGFEPQYFAIRQAGDLQPVRDNSKELVILTAAKLGKTRLIDNITVTRPDRTVVPLRRF